jgi:hypothetical protein
MDRLFGRTSDTGAQRRATIVEPSPPPPTADPHAPADHIRLLFGPRSDTGVQRRATTVEPTSLSAHQAAAQGVATPSSPLPYAHTIGRLFGRHDVASIQAHQGPEAVASAQAMGAQAYATGNHVVLGATPDLHTVAHEAAHVVQQRGGVQLQGGVGKAGDAYERHADADAVADRVVAGQSAEALLDAGAASSSVSHAVQRKAGDGKDDASLLEHQASLAGTDVEIPALEGALLTTRKTAVQLGLLSPASFDAGLALSRTMAQLQPAVAARGAVDPLIRELAATAALQLYGSLHHETRDDEHFQFVPSTEDGPSLTTRNPYTEQTRVTTSFLVGSTTHSYGGDAQQRRFAAIAASSTASTCGSLTSCASRARPRPRRRSATRTSTTPSSVPASTRSPTSTPRGCRRCSTPTSRPSLRSAPRAAPPPTPSR